MLVIETLPQILTGTDLEIGKTLGRILKKQGVEIMLDTKVGELEKSGNTVSATFNGEGTGGKDETREFDMALVAVGRRPVTDNLNLAAAGLATDEHRLHRHRSRSSARRFRTSSRSATSPASRCSRIAR